MSYAAIPTRYGGSVFRSRLEAKWAAFFDLLGWQGRWDFEAVDFGGASGIGKRGRIPDFLLHFEHPTLIECKPAFSVSEIWSHRRSLVSYAADWLCEDLERELRELDAAPEAADDLARADRIAAEIEAVRRDYRNPSHGRRALVVGSQLFTKLPDAATIDGEHVLVDCGDHVGLRAPSDACLVCGIQRSEVGAPIPSSSVFETWREAGSKVQWKPPT